MRLIDAEPIIKNLSAMETKLGYDAIDIDGMIKALREAEEVTPSPPPNDPLTLEELREMDGEPVWVRSIPDACEGCWMCIYGKRCENPSKIVHFEDYGKSWLAYLRKPEEGTPCM